MDTERYKQEQTITPDEAHLRALGESTRDEYNALVAAQSSGNLAEAKNKAKGVFGNIILIDQMGRATEKGAIEGHRIMGRNPVLSETLEEALNFHRTTGNDEEVLKDLRIGHLLGYTEVPLLVRAEEYLRDYCVLHPAYHPLRKLADYLGQRVDGREKMNLYDQLFEEHKIQLEAKRQAATAAAAAAASPDWAPEDITAKSAEWTEARKDIETAWQAITPPPPNDISPVSELIRLTVGFDLIQKEIASLRLNDTTRYRIQAMIEFLIPKIWLQKDYFKDFFDNEWDPYHTTNPQFIADLSEITQAILIPETLRNRATPLTNRAEKRAITKIRNYLVSTLHPDKVAANPDTNPDTVEQTKDLFKGIQSTYDIIKDNLL